MKPRRQRLSAVVVAIGAALVVASSAFGASRPVKLALKLPAKPAFPRPETAALLTAGPVTLELTDDRTVDDPAVVGAQREKGKDLYLWRTAQPVAETVRGMAAEILGGWSVRVAPEAELGLKLSLSTFYVTEKSETFGSTYLADVRLKVAVVDRAGGVLWTGEARGDSKSPGVDQRQSMCNEAFSIALREALANALTSITLETAKPVVAASAAAPATALAIEPDALFADLMRLKAGGVTEDSLVAYVEQRKLSRPLTVDEILRWKDAGLPDAVIKAAMRP